MSKLQQQQPVQLADLTQGDSNNEEFKHMECDDYTSKMATRFVDEILDSAIGIIASKIGHIEKKGLMTTEGESCLYTRKAMLDAPSVISECHSEGQGDVHHTEDDGTTIWRCIGPLVSDLPMVTSSEAFDDLQLSNSSEEDLAAWEEANECTLQVIMHEDDDDEKYLEELSQKLPGVPVHTMAIEGGVTFSPLMSLPGIRVRRRATVSTCVPETVKQNAVKADISAAAKLVSTEEKSKKRWKIGKRLRKLFGKTRLAN